MWVERKPEVRETVMVEFADFTKLGYLVGVVVNKTGDRYRIDFGNVIRNLDYTSTFFVWV